MERPLKISASLTVWRCPFHHAVVRPLLGRPEVPDFPDWRGSFHHAAERPLLGRPEVPDCPVCSLLEIEREDWKGILDELVIFWSYPGNHCFELQLVWKAVEMPDFAAQWAVSRYQRYLLPLNLLRTYSFSCLILVSVLVLIIKPRKRWKWKCRLLCIFVRIAFVISFLFEISLTSFYAGFCAFVT